MNRRGAVSVMIALALPCLVRGEGAGRGRPELRAEEVGWRYPGSKVASGGGGSGQVSGSAVVMMTDDPMDDVIAFYEKKIGRGLTVSMSSWSSKTASAPVRLIQVEAEGRPLRLRILEEQGPDRSMLLVISRANDDRQTRIDWSIVLH